MERRITVRGIIFKEGTLFAQKLKDTDGERNYWCTPGGGLDPGEGVIDGLIREMIEETNIVPKVGKLLYIQQYADPYKEFLEFFFHIENPEDYHTIDLTKTSHGMIEVSRCEFVDPASENILPEFLQPADIAGDIANTRSVRVINYLPPTEPV